ncbi:RNA polymerase sigma-I factor [Desulfitobacterium dichloroeliminans LMG P-21439]|uniref:RNA polymerase sigma factor SigI n=1 Tax=Desulfitobacterium dichloroeliminans (strain LMG P-21439 / DCA1) TaxID=871963 RepID=L0F7D7_DESDL|nr:RNA polymerase sigma-I factor [Desulfitobacterium dichloroeliminans]AGA68878.1 RNA polymerase sigma-I factor [Desulfitobacterium dichloroeliminans LMG P-21439]
MQGLPFKENLVSAQQGDTLAREELIQSYKPFIAKVSSKICNRYLTWDNDDELSIALLAFNEAIDHFNPQGGAEFLSFAQTVIHRRLVDYFRKEGKHQHLSLSPMNPEDEELSRYDMNLSQEQYQEEQKKMQFAEVIENYVRVLNEYGVTLDDLVKVSPKHRDSKETLIRVTLTLVNYPHLLAQLKKQKLLPMKELELLTRVKRKVLEKGRKYIIALALILSESEFYALKTFLEITTELTE